MSKFRALFLLGDGTFRQDDNQQADWVAKLSQEFDPHAVVFSVQPDSDPDDWTEDDPTGLDDPGKLADLVAEEAASCSSIPIRLTSLDKNGVMRFLEIATRFKTGGWEVHVALCCADNHRSAAIRFAHDWLSGLSIGPKPDSVFWITGKVKPALKKKTKAEAVESLDVRDRVFRSDNEKDLVDLKDLLRSEHFDVVECSKQDRTNHIVVRFSHPVYTNQGAIDILFGNGSCYGMILDFVADNADRLLLDDGTVLPMPDEFALQDMYRSWGFDVNRVEFADPGQMSVKIHFNHPSSDGELRWSINMSRMVSFSCEKEYLAAYFERKLAVGDVQSAHDEDMEVIT